MDADSIYINDNAHGNNNDDSEYERKSLESEN